MIKKSIAGLLLIVGIGFLPSFAKEKTQTNNPQVLGLQTSFTESTIKPTPEFANLKPLPTLTARSVLAYDLNSGSVLYSNNFDEKVPIASLTKIMTALVAFDELKFNQIVRIKKENIQIIGSNMGLVPEEQISVENLFKGMLVSSSNDAAKALAVAAAGTEMQFVSQMNARAARLGLNSTHFMNPAGLDSEDHYSTAYDLLKLTEEFLKNKTLSNLSTIKETEVKSFNGEITHRLKTTNKLMLENDNIAGVKTGFTSLAKGNLIIRLKGGSNEILTIVLGSDNREEDTKLLLEWILSVYKW